VPEEHLNLVRHFARITAAVSLAACTSVSAQRLEDLTPASTIPPGSTLVVGYLGGFERWNDEHRSVRRLALRLRQIPGVVAESVENHRRPVAVKWLLRSLDTNRNGELDASERDSARVVLYGQSFGAAAAVHTARDLEKRGIPVLLTVQVDSVGFRDKMIPPNVGSAVNYYQHDPFTIWGRSEIRAEDPSRTKILGNIPSTYLFRDVDQKDSTWVRRTFGGGHAKMEADPILWKQVEFFIADAIAAR
jgi:hypothetical protein